MLQTVAKVDYSPYGVDYPRGPTGRFTNGRNIVDFFAEYLGFECPIPPFATATDIDTLTGVNYVRRAPPGSSNKQGRNGASEFPWTYNWTTMESPFPRSPRSLAPPPPPATWASAYTPSESATTISSTITSAPSFIPPAALTPSSSSPPCSPTDTRSSFRDCTGSGRGKSVCLRWARLDAFLLRSVGTVTTGRLLDAPRRKTTLPRYSTSG
ncbi:unnamed protein product [Linum tenue]|uniref:Uncharacterized protein n=1 Tax=Linum tenue TaxID=586396 RepID=A0AAV0PVV0_9ROSI|nr:unnamed protein product [Linum tenue]